MRPRSRNIFLLCYGCWLAAIVGVLAFTTSSCTTTKPASPEAQAALVRLTEGKTFVFDAQYALPTASQDYLSAAQVGQARGNSPTQINVSGDGYFLKVSESSVEVYLPYFGRRDNVTQMAGRGGIELSGEITDWTVTDSKAGKTVQFFARDGYERFRFLLDVAPSGRAQLSVFSPQRDVIRYTGHIRELEKRS